MHPDHPVEFGGINPVLTVRISPFESSSVPSTDGPLNEPCQWALSCVHTYSVQCAPSALTIPMIDPWIMPNKTSNIPNALFWCPLITSNIFHVDSDEKF